MASKSALEQIKFQRRFNAQQSSRLRGLERSFAEMVARAQDPRWWEQRQAALDVDVARSDPKSSDPKKENQVNWNGSEAPSPPKTKRIAVWGGFEGVGMNGVGWPKARRGRKFSPRSAQPRSAQPRSAQPRSAQPRTSPRATGRATGTSSLRRASSRSAAAGRLRRVSPRSRSTTSSKSRITVERKDRKVQNLIKGGPVLLSPRYNDDNGTGRSLRPPAYASSGASLMTATATTATAADGGPSQKENATRAPLPPRQRNAQFPSAKPVNNAGRVSRPATKKTNALTGIRQREQGSISSIIRRPGEEEEEEEEEVAVAAVKAGDNNNKMNIDNNDDTYEDKYAEDEFEDAFEEDEYSSGDDDFEVEIRAAMTLRNNSGDVASNSRVDRPQRNQPTRLGRGEGGDGKQKKQQQQQQQQQQQKAGVAPTTGYSYSDDDFVQDDDGSDFGYSDDEFERIA